jgi:hypothetical protein
MSEVILAILGVSNGATFAMSVWLWGRVRHLEGVVEGRATSAVTVNA